MIIFDEHISIIPNPKKISAESKDGRYVAFELFPSIISDDGEFEGYISSFALYAEKITGIRIDNVNGGIVLRRDAQLAAGEYHLECKETGVTVSASDPDGITAALATLLQIINAKEGVIYVPSCVITDRPDCSYRTLMVDIARKWHSYETLKTYVDICYLYKIKYLHIHFIDDESYTLPSELLPKLASEGRGYSKKQIAELNEYAFSRNVEIIPEIEVPGHAATLVKSYPELFANKDAEGNVTHANILCAGKPEIYDTVSALIDEIIDMFPHSSYIHIGGDEAAIDVWESCEDCKKYMADNSISGKYPLYTRFIKNVTDLVLSKGKTPIVWEGFPKDGSDEISKDVIVTAWESLYHLAPDLVEEGFTITNASWEPLYIVEPDHFGVPGGRWYPEDILKWTPFVWKNWWDKSYAYASPITVQPTNQVIGGTLCSWGCTHEQSLQPIKENLAALSERLWNIDCQVDADVFKRDLDRLLALADKALE